MNTPDIYADEPELTLDYKIAVMTAVRAGALVEVRAREYHGQKHRWHSTADTIVWNWLSCDYRISPRSRPKKIVPRGPDDYPPLFWIRDGSLSYLVTAVLFDGVMFNERFYFFTDLRTTFYSTDRKTWLPCTKEVDA